MKTRIKKTEECTKLFEIEIPKELVERIKDEVYREIKKIAKIPGFRVGFVPQDILEKHYSKDAEEEILKRLIPQGYEKVVQNHKIIPIGIPRISNVNLQKGKSLTFEIQVDVRPVFRLRDYNGVRVKKKKISVSKDEVNSAFSRIGELHAQFKSVDRVIEKGDYAICDIEAFIDNKPITKKNKDMRVSVDKESSLLGIGEELVGLTKGDVKEIEATLPDTYPDKKYAGKRTLFKVQINDVKEKELPQIDDAFAKRMNTENVEELRREIENQLFMRKKQNQRIHAENQIIEKLLKDNKFSIPKSLIKSQKEILAKRIESDLSRKGLSENQIKEEIEKAAPKLQEDAIEKVKLYFILDEIAKKEEISVTDEDVTDRFKSIAIATGRSEENVKDYYEKNNLIEGFKEEVKEEKVLDLLFNRATVTEEK